VPTATIRTSAASPRPPELSVCNSEAARTAMSS
jgi:hypothetical protein